MAIPLLPYSAEHYNSLPELRKAKDQFKSLGASEILFNKIGPALVRHHVEGILGVVLLHNHFLLSQNEKLVGFGSAAVPCAGELPNVTASSWRFISEGIVPYEFVCSDAKTSLAQTQQFLAEFRAIINEWKLANVFGICSLKEDSIGGPVTTEFMSGRANITLPFDITPDDGNLVDAMWQFSSTPPGSSVQVASNMQPAVFGQCKNRCKGSPHEERHISNT